MLELSVRVIGKLRDMADEEFEQLELTEAISIADAFSAALKREQTLQIWAAWPFPENFSFALYSPHILQ